MNWPFVSFTLGIFGAFLFAFGFFVCFGFCVFFFGISHSFQNGALRVYDMGWDTGYGPARQYVGDCLGTEGGAILQCGGLGYLGKKPPLFQCIIDYLPYLAEGT